MMLRSPPALGLATLLLAAAALIPAPAAFGQATTNPASPAGPAAKPPSAARRTPPPPREGWWSDAVFYEIFVRSFADARVGPLAGDGVGDLRGLIERLDYLNDGDPATTTDLGVTALWLMPIQPAPSYHGYDTIDYRGINPDYGAMPDFRDLLAACRKRGIRVVIDLVLNHHSDRHPWFVGAEDPASPRHDWYIWADPNPGFAGPWGQRVWHRAPGGRPGVYYGIFGREMPDLNYRNPEVSRQMTDLARFWLADVGIDGFRLDAIRHLIEDGPVQENTPETMAWLAQFRAQCLQARPDAFTVGEVWSDSDTSAAYVGDQLDSTFDFELAGALMKAASSGDAGGLQAALEKTWSAYPLGQASTFLTNHDQTRVMTALKGDAAAARVAAALLLTLPGVPFIYYGEELGMVGDKPDPQLRTPMQWGPSPSALPPEGNAPAWAGPFTTGKPWRAENRDAQQVSVARQTDDPASLLNLYRRLLRLRTSHPALARGDLKFLKSTQPGVLAFARSRGDQTIVAILNLGKSPVAPELDAAALPAGAAGVVLDFAQPAPAPAIVPVNSPAAPWRPVGQLDGRSWVVIRLAPAPAGASRPAGPKPAGP